MQLLAPLLTAVVPTLHVAQACVGLALYWPALHSVHVMAPVDERVFVTAPTAQVAHATVETALYKPAAHLVQLEAPGFKSLSVTAPAAHSVHVLAYRLIAVFHVAAPLYPGTQSQLAMLLSPPSMPAEFWLWIGHSTAEHTSVTERMFWRPEPGVVSK
eukprot:COSAG01_NODE_13485_length_1579_cov_0.828378_2_plen_157_part_01